MVLAAANPLAGLAMAAGGAGAAGAAGAAGKQTPGVATNEASAATATNHGVAVAQKSSDPAYVVAGELRDLVTHFYEFLGGDSKSIDWSKFEESKEDAASSEETQSGSAYLAATLKGRKGELDVTETEVNKKVLATIESLITVR
jgi:hypothetical protein